MLSRSWSRLLYSLLVLLLVTFLAPAVKSLEPVSPQLSVEQDLDVLRAMQGKRLSPLARRMFRARGGFDGARLAFWIRSRLGPIHWGCPGTFAIACRGRQGTGLTPRYFQLNQIERISILFHEAAHAGGGSGHTTCPRRALDGSSLTNFDGTKSLRGEIGCDANLYGAYVQQIVFLKNVASNCETCTTTQRSSADAIARALLPRIIARDVLAQVSADE